MNSRARKENEANKRREATYEFWKKKEAEAKKKLDLISSLRSAKLELSNEQARIQSDIDLCIKEHAQRLEEKMREFGRKSFY